MDLSQVQTSEERKVVCDDGVALRDQEFLDAEAAKKLLDLQNHFCKVIAAWCNTSDPSSTTATESSISLNIESLVGSDCLDEWQTALEAKGYTVTRDGVFKVEITPVVEV